MEQQTNFNNTDIKEVKVLLQTKDKKVDVNKQGLTSLRFTRYLADTQDRMSNVLTELDITAFDTTGYDFLNVVQQSGGSLYLQYGFTDNLSPIYHITPTKYNVVQTNRGIMVGIGGFGQQHKLKTGAEVYQEGTPIYDIIVALSQRNSWYIGEQDEFGKYPNIKIFGKTLKTTVKQADETDFDFIKNTLLPIADSSTVYDSKTGRLITGYKGFYEVILHEHGGIGELHVFPQNEGSINRNVWSYEYGVDRMSKVLEMTNQINYDWIMGGMTLSIPIFPEQYIMTQEDLDKDYTELLNNIKDDLLKVFKANNIVPPELKNLTYKINFYDAGDVEYKTKEEIVTEHLNKVINTFNTMSLTVLGNPRIMATDLIDLKSVNKDGLNTIQNGLWRITGIEEIIGLNGYHTKLQLVRETKIDLTKDTVEGSRRYV